MQEEITAQEETVEEKKARLLERMQREARGKKLSPKKTAADHRRINDFYGKKVEEYTDNMTLEQMKDVDIESLKGTDKHAFVDALMFKVREEAEELAKSEAASLENEGSSVDEEDTSEAVETV